MRRNVLIFVAAIFFGFAMQTSAQAASFRGSVFDPRPFPVNRIEVTFFGERKERGPVSAPIVPDPSDPQKGYFRVHFPAPEELGNVKACKFRLFRNQQELRLWDFHDRVDKCESGTPLNLIVVDPPRFDVHLTVRENRGEVLENFRWTSHSIFPGLALKRDAQDLGQFSHMPYPTDVKETEEGLDFSVKDTAAWALRPEDFKEGSAKFSFRAAPREWTEIRLTLDRLVRYSGGKIAIHRVYPDDFYLRSWTRPPGGPVVVF